MTVEAAMIWNEPNNKSHWDPVVDPDWSRLGELVTLAGRAIRAANPQLPRVLGGMSPIDPAFITRMDGFGAMEEIDVVAVHGFPLDWNLWSIHDWPAKLDEIRAVIGGRPLWVSEVGVSSFGAEEVAAWGVTTTARHLIGRSPRIHWYSLYDLPREWEATTRHKEAEGSSYYRHFAMGLLDQDGRPKQALEAFRPHAGPEGFGLCQWFHFQDHRLDEAVRWMRDLGVTYLRTGLSWADAYRPWRPRLVRPADGGAGRLRRHGHLLLHPRAQGRRAPPLQRPPRPRRVRRVLRTDGRALRPRPGGGPRTGTGGVSPPFPLEGEGRVHANWTWITPRLLVGGEVWPEEWPTLSAQGVQAAVDLRDEAVDDAAALAQLGVAHLHLPTPDHHAPSQDALDQGVAFVRDAGGPVLVHCREGVGRSATLALCILADAGDEPLAALERAKDARWQVSPSPAQYEAWAAWLRRHGVAPPTFEAFAAVAYRRLG